MEMFNWRAIRAWANTTQQTLGCEAGAKMEYQQDDEAGPRLFLVLIAFALLTVWMMYI
jgi:hypothetical protein